MSKSNVTQLPVPSAPGPARMDDPELMIELCRAKALLSTYLETFPADGRGDDDYLVIDTARGMLQGICDRL